MKNVQSPKQSGYRVPEGYFDQMRAQVMGRVSQMEQRGQMVRPAWRSAVAFAASFVGLVVLAVGGYYLTGYSSRQTELAAAQEEEVMLFYELEEEEFYDIPEFNSAMLADAAIDYLEIFGDLPSGELTGNQ